jgi:YfiH family protein
MLTENPFLVPDWPVPDHINSLMSTRMGGVSTGPFASMNLRPSGLFNNPQQPQQFDVTEAIALNQQRYAQALRAHPVYLDQVHGTKVLHVGSHTPDLLQADAAVTTEVGVAPTVLVADCLPVLFCTADGHAVGAAHAGWRGLAGGVLENTVAALRELCGRAQTPIYAWLGPCIGPAAFEVGEDVLRAFGIDPDVQPNADPHLKQGFQRYYRQEGRQRWLANLPLLARERLRFCGVEHISGGQWCTYTQSALFYSYRQESVTGRMAASVCKMSNCLK